MWGVRDSPAEPLHVLPQINFVVAGIAQTLYSPVLAGIVIVLLLLHRLRSTRSSLWPRRSWWTPTGPAMHSWAVSHLMTLQRCFFLFYKNSFDMRTQHRFLNDFRKECMHTRQCKRQMMV
jgi:hypothetical protein